jgi:hypothetical protein
MIVSAGLPQISAGLILHRKKLVDNGVWIAIIAGVLHCSKTAGP